MPHTIVTGKNINDNKSEPYVIKLDEVDEPDDEVDEVPKFGIRLPIFLDTCDLVGIMSIVAVGANPSSARVDAMSLEVYSFFGKLECIVNASDSFRSLNFCWLEKILIYARNRNLINKRMLKLLEQQTL